MQVFGPSETWPSQDLIAFSDEFDLRMTLAAYGYGAFPMALHEERFEARMLWWSPMRR